ncbi:MAG TPA: PocR ligand-binding domain-containing protein [Magnetospirillum sp.]|nr:PocR ligand-binding domain-containing protein [Magnetospirillum sp.]
MKLSELLPITELQELCEQFTALTGAVTAIVDLEGNILIATGWQDICTRFHRVNPGTAARCRESDTVLAARLKKGEAYNVYKCRNGLVDVAVPIVFMGEHVGNFFTGQFLTSPPDAEAFQAQASQFDFPQDEYLGALSRVPVFSDEQIRLIMGFFTRLTHLIGEMGVARMKEEVAKQELQKSRQLLQTIIDTVPIRIFWKDRSSRYLGCNPLFSRDAGYSSPEEMIGKDDYQMAWADRAELYRADDRAVMETGLPKLFFDEQVQSQDGRLMWVRTSKIPLKNDDSEVIGVLGIYEDITDRKTAEQMLIEKNDELQRSNLDLEQFAYVSSHDLQTPLRNIVLFSQMLERRYKGALDSEADEFIRFIVDSGKQMSSLISDILQYSRVVSRKEALACIPAADAAATAMDNLALEIAGSHAVITIAELPQVLAEPSLLTSLFQNLIGNAIKYRAADRQPEISVRAERMAPDRVLFAVTDNGIGIDPAYHEKIFEIFQRLNPSPDTDGTGIGLTLCRRIVHRFGGDIWLDSTPGVGTTFFFSLRTCA